MLTPNGRLFTLVLGMSLVWLGSAGLRAADPSDPVSGEGPSDTAGMKELDLPGADYDLAKLLPWLARKSDRKLRVEGVVLDGQVRLEDGNYPPAELIKVLDQSVLRERGICLRFVGSDMLVAGPIADKSAYNDKTPRGASDESMRRKLTSPKDLPDHVRVESKLATNGMVEFTVRIHPNNALEVNEDVLFQGRMSVAGTLQVGAAKSIIARTMIEADRDIYGRHPDDSVTSSALARKIFIGESAVDIGSSGKVVIGEEVIEVASAEDTRTTYRFEIAPAFARHSTFFLSARRHDTNGKPKIGSGISYEIVLDEFVPAAAEKPEKPKR